MLEPTQTVFTVLSYRTPASADAFQVTDTVPADLMVSEELSG